MIGGTTNTQEVMDLCGKHGIIPDTKVITADGIDGVWDELTTGGNASSLRYVIDIKKSLASDFVPK